MVLLLPVQMRATATQHHVDVRTSTEAVCDDFKFMNSCCLLDGLSKGGARPIWLSVRCG